MDMRFHATTRRRAPGAPSTSHVIEPALPRNIRASQKGATKPFGAVAVGIDAFVPKKVARVRDEVVGGRERQLLVNGAGFGRRERRCELVGQHQSGAAERCPGQQGAEDHHLPLTVDETGEQAFQEPRQAHEIRREGESRFEVVQRRLTVVQMVQLELAQAREERGALSWVFRVLDTRRENPTQVCPAITGGIQSFQGREGIRRARPKCEE